MVNDTRYFPQLNMKQRSIRITSLLITGIFACTSLFFVPGSTINADKKLSAYFMEQTKLLTGEIRKLRLLQQQKTPIKQQQASFGRARNIYKKIEALVEYYYPPEAKLINGPNLLQVEADNTNVPTKPRGFQVIEEMLFAKTYPAAKMAEETSHLLGTLQQLLTKIPELQIESRRIFYALRLQLFRIEALGITGFDSPVARRSVAEAGASMQGIKEMVLIYAEDQQQRFPEIKQILQLLNGTERWLAANTNFDTFNRAYFIREMANPVASLLLDVQMVLHIPVLAGNRPVKNDARHLFAKDIVNMDFFDGNNNEELQLTTEKIMIGKKLFYDSSLSPTSRRSCASCHIPEKAFTDGLTKSLSIDGHTSLPRNAPTLWNAAIQSAQFWDNRVATLEEQIEKVITNKMEMDGNLEEAVNYIFKDSSYRALFSKAYGSQRTPLSYRNTINALASYIRSLVALNSRADRYLRGEAISMSREEINGFNLFMGKAKCATCHFVPFFNGQLPPYYDRQEAEVIGVPANKKGKTVDEDEGRYNQYKVALLRYQFKVPTLRNISLTAPYMHNGVFSTLDEVVNFYNNGGGGGWGIYLPNQTLPREKLLLTAIEKNDLVAFLGALTDTGMVKK